MSRGQRLTFMAGTIYMIGAFLPWLVLAMPDGSTQTLNALSLPNGIFMISIGGLLLVTGVAYRGRPGRRYAMPLAILSAATAFLIGIIGIRLNQAVAVPAGGQTASLGPGLILSFVSTLIALAGGASPVPELPAKKQP